MYKELKGRDSQRPRSNDLTKTTNTTSIDGPGGETLGQSEIANAKASPLMSFSPESSPPITSKRPHQSKTEDADLLGLSSPIAQAEVVRNRPSSRTGSVTSWGDFPLQVDITGSFSADLLKEFDSQQGNLTRKILVESSSDELVSTASSSDDEDAAEAPPVPPRPDESDIGYYGGGLPPPAYPPPPLELESTFSSTNPFCVMGMAPSIFSESSRGLPTLPSRPPAPREYQTYQSSSKPSAYLGQVNKARSAELPLTQSSTGASRTSVDTLDPFARLEAEARESHLLSRISPRPTSREASPLASSAFNSDIRDRDVVVRTTSLGKRDSLQRKVVVSSELDLDAFDPLKESQ